MIKDSILIALEVVAVNDEERVWMQGDILLLINTEKPYTEHDIVDFNLLLKSIEKEGTYHLITCCCGMPDCNGRPNGIKVTHDFENIFWEDLDKKENWTFERKSILQQMEEIRKEVEFYKQYFQKKDIDYVGVGCNW